MQQVHRELLQARIRPTSAFTCVPPRERNSLSFCSSLLSLFLPLSLLSLFLSRAFSLVLYRLRLRASLSSSRFLFSRVIPRELVVIPVFRALLHFFRKDESDRTASIRPSVRPFNDEECETLSTEASLPLSLLRDTRQREKSRGLFSSSLLHADTDRRT